MQKNSIRIEDFRLANVDAASWRQRLFDSGTSSHSDLSAFAEYMYIFSKNK